MMELVHSHCTEFNSGSSGQLFSGQVKVEPSTLEHIASGYYRVDYQLCQERVAVKCSTCAQQLWVKDTPNSDSCLRLTFRKGQQSNELYKGYLVSSEVPKAKQTKQVVCLSCIERLLGSIAESADGQSIILGCRRDGGAEAVILQRHGAAFWTQCLELTTEILAFLTQQNESTVVRKKRALNAAERVINMGAAKGVRQRGPRQEEVPATTDAGDAEGLTIETSIKGQALRYLDMIGNGACHISVPAESACPPLRFYMSGWDHNGRGRAKPLGKPDKSCALLEHVWWDTLGQLNCTCDRGRLTEDAPCVHKLAMAALSESWIRGAELPTRQMLGRGVRVERLASDEKGSYFAVRDNPNGVSRRMVFRSKGGGWYCQGKRDGCPSLTDCSHIVAAKAALIKGEVPTTEALVLGSGPRARAAMSWLESFNGIDGPLPLIGAPAVELSLGSDKGAERNSGSSRGGGGEQGGRGKGELSDEERYLLGLLERRPHKEAACAGDSCFCKTHEFLFGEARPPTEERREGQDGRHDAEGSNEMTEVPHAPKRARRSKVFWKAEAQRRPTEVARSGANGRLGQRSGPPADARGRDAIHGWVDACSSCKLSSLAAGGGCEHARGGEERHLKAPEMLLSTEATQVSKPKLARLSDAPNFHDPWVTVLSGSPIRVSRLRDCHFKELSDLGLLTAPCPLQPPPCGGCWAEKTVEASVTASQWSQKVEVRIYHCDCPDEAHTIHFDGEHLGLYTWNRRTLFVQQSLQLLLRGMQHGHSFKAELATNQTAFQQCPEAEVLSEETWRRASLDFFKLLGLGIRDCCTLCGPHPKVLLCDGIVGLANSDGGKRPGGLGSTTLDARRTAVHPSKFENGQLLQKRSISGQDYCGAGLEGGGMKKKLILQPELREAIARLSQHRPKDEKVGQMLSEAEFGALLDGLASDPCTVKGFGPGEEEGLLPEDGRRRMLVEQRTMVRDRNLAILELLRGIQGDFERQGMNGNLWESWVGQWTELLYFLGAHDSDEDLIGAGALHVVSGLLLGGEATLEDRRQLGRSAPILRRILDAYGGLTFPGFFMQTLHLLYLLTLLARGLTGFEGEGRLGWVADAIRPFDQAVWLLAEARARPLGIDERRRLEQARALANELLPGVESLAPSPQQWAVMSEREKALLWERLDRDEEGVSLHPLPEGHSFRAEQDALARYDFPGWEQYRGLPHFSDFEHPDGRSKGSEEFKCATGKTVTEWDFEHVPGLVKGGGKAGRKGAVAKRPNRSRGAFLFCCPHRLIIGCHVMLRGESPRDPFAVLYTRLRREDLPETVVYDNACALRNYSMRRAPGHFSDVRFVVDRFHFAKAGAEVHKCGPSNSADLYESLNWVNTSAVESVNSFLKGFRSLGWYSSLESFMVILPLLLGGYNAALRRVDDAKLCVAIAAGAWTAAIARALLQG